MKKPDCYNTSNNVITSENNFKKTKNSDLNENWTKIRKEKGI